ncbi:MAG: methyltransferase domain-containing protein [Balneolaceae bacterium]|nr:methyltransferase domain-containing protein [Balneolaceae bacterium]
MTPGNDKALDHTRSRYDFIAPLYNLMEWPIERLFFRRWRKILWERVEGPRVLEIGIGTGKNIPYYPEGVEVTGIDISSGMLSRAEKMVRKRDIEHLSLKRMDAQDMDFDSHTFDQVAATFAFCSIPDPVRGLEEAMRVTRPGGRLYLLEHMISKNPTIARMMKFLDKPFHYLSGVHIARDTVQNVKTAGWESVEVKDLVQNGIVRFITGRKRS